MDRHDPLIHELRARVRRASFFRKLVEEGRRSDVTGATVEARALLIAALQEQSGRRVAIVTAG
ncbi:MAG TPA: hypothetical protein VFO89_05180, partial [Thermoanaerobaculia bacterium]|nr:hypothetical protein [Thermoanaerobaculia bacterium]